MTGKKIKKGCVLIAQYQSSCSDIFDQSLILIADHNNKGSVGFILNKSSDFTIHDLLPDVHAKFKIYLGGPVEPESLYFLHNVPHLIENSVKICENIYWGGDFSIVKELLNTNILKKDDIMFFLGYSGWGVNQLLDEIEEEHWIIDYPKKSIFNQVTNNWQKKILEHNPDLVFWINAPNNPSYN